MGKDLWTIPEKCGLFLKISDFDFWRIRSEVWSILENVAFSTFPSEETATLRGSENKKTEGLSDFWKFLNWNMTCTPLERRSLLKGPPLENLVVVERAFQVPAF